MRSGINPRSPVAALNQSVWLWVTVENAVVASARKQPVHLNVHVPVLAVFSLFRQSSLTGGFLQAGSQHHL